MAADDSAEEGAVYQNITQSTPTNSKGGINIDVFGGVKEAPSLRL